MIIRSEHEILRGTLIPIGLMLVLFLGYGSVLAFTRQGHLKKAEATYADQPQKALELELKKANRDNNAYTSFKPVWVILIIVSAGLYFLFSSHHLKGLSVGLIGMFLSVLVVDLCLHYRLSFYLKGLNELQASGL